MAKKDDTEQKLLPHMYVKKSWHLAEILKADAKIDGKYQESLTHMNEKHIDKDQFTTNIDKGGNGINTSIRHVHRKDGNSQNHTDPIALTEGSVCQCYKN